MLKSAGESTLRAGNPVRDQARYRQGRSRRRTPGGRASAASTTSATEGIADPLTQHPGVKVRVDVGYRGLASALAEQVTAPHRKPAKDAAELVAA
jgi:hypothetical protein